MEALWVSREAGQLQGDHMKTVAEANKHVCVQAAGNETAVVCRADICMAWRWEPIRFRESRANADPKDPRRKGWCGLTSKPE